MLTGPRAALERLAVIEPEATVTSASVAKPVGAYRNGRGGTMLATTAGWVTYNIVVLGLADGRRLMVGVHCEPRMERESGSIPARCQADAAPVNAPRVGAGTLAPRRLTLRTVLDKRQDP